MDIFNLDTQEVLERISRHCPECLTVYLQCINRANEDGVVVFTRTQVDVQMSEDWRRFRQHIKTLARENLLEWQPLDGAIHVTLARS